jgi:hypothetical protein
MKLNLLGRQLSSIMSRILVQKVPGNAPASTG